jgi:hypothetical protein
VVAVILILQVVMEAQVVEPEGPLVVYEQAELQVQDTMVALTMAHHLHLVVVVEPARQVVQRMIHLPEVQVALV